MYFFIALAIAVLSGLGVGGGGLFALYLKFFSDFSQMEIQALNLLFFLFASFFALVVHLMRRKIYGLALLVLCVFGAIGSLVGSGAARAIEGELLGKIFGVMLILTGVYSFRKKE